MRTHQLRLHTGSRLVVDITGDVLEFCQGQGDGLLTVFVPHATAGLALVETGSGSESDLQELLGRLLPRDDRWAHRHGSAGHGGDHVMPALLSPSVSIPVVGGRPLLGTWQSICVVDPNVDNPDRTVHLSLLPG